MNLIITLGAATPTGDALLSWLVVLGFLMFIALGIKNLTAKKPTHAELATKRELESYVRRGEFAEFKAEVRGDMKEIKAMITNAVDRVENFAEKSYQARKAIHRQVNEIDKKQAALEAVQTKFIEKQ